MGFMEDIWTALLSDNEEEEAEAVERIAADPVASQIAGSVLTRSPGAPQEREGGDPVSDQRESRSAINGIRVA